jgi:hypothetical protein
MGKVTNKAICLIQRTVGVGNSGCRRSVSRSGRPARAADGAALRSLEIGQKPLQIGVVAAAQQRGMRGWRGSSAGVGGRLLGR